VFQLQYQLFFKRLTIHLLNTIFKFHTVLVSYPVSIQIYFNSIFCLLLDKSSQNRYRMAYNSIKRHLKQVRYQTAFNLTSS